PRRSSDLVRAPEEIANRRLGAKPKPHAEVKTVYSIFFRLSIYFFRFFRLFSRLSTRFCRFFRFKSSKRRKAGAKIRQAEDKSPPSAGRRAESIYGLLHPNDCENANNT